MKFCCEDLTNATVDVDNDGELDAGYVEVWMRVWDDGDMDGVYGSSGDNYNETWAYVKVEDKLAPAIVCPPDITITCADDYTDTSVTGVASAYGSCGGVEVEYNDIIVNLNSCNEGFVRRRWNVVGNSAIFCDQTITIEDLDGPEAVVSFSQVQDFEATGCPDNIQIGEPTWIGGPCDVIGYTVETDTFLFEDGACYKLVNTYTVINWCVYDPNSSTWVETPDFSDGHITHTQVIKVTDDTQPVIQDCEAQMYAINDHDDSDNDGIICEGKITLKNSAIDPGSDNCPTSWLKWTVLVDLWGDGTYDYEYSSFLPPFDSQFNDTNGNGIPDRYISATANGEEVMVPLVDIEGSMSNHKVKWKVTDGCGNTHTCESTFMVVDKKAPTPYCINISSAVMEETGTVELWAIDFNIGSFDNCTAQEDLRYTFTSTAPEEDPTYNESLRSSSMVFDQEDVSNSPVTVTMYVWDEKGNSDYCEVLLTLVDNGGNQNRAMISGAFKTEDGDMVHEVMAELMSNLPEYPINEMVDGPYAFEELEMNVAYEVSGLKDNDWLNGVSTLDLVKIQRHILEIEQLGSVYKVIAADINGDESVKASDLTVLRKLILGVISEVEGNTSWKFVDASQEFSDMTNPWPIRESINTGLLTSDMLGQDFVGVKIGDVSGNVNPGVKGTSLSEVRGAGTVLTYEDREVEKGEEVTVVFKTAEGLSLYGYQFTMNLDGLEYVSSTIDAQGIAVQRDQVSVSQAIARGIEVSKGAEVFAMTFEAGRAGQLSEMLAMVEDVVSAEAYIGEGLNVSKLSLRTEPTVMTVAENVLYQNEPNPFKDVTKIGFDLAKSGKVTLTISDVAGKVLKVIEAEGKRGYNTITLKAKDINTSASVLYYQIESGDFTATKKMILVK